MYTFFLPIGFEINLKLLYKRKLYLKRSFCQKLEELPFYVCVCSKTSSTIITQAAWNFCPPSLSVEMEVCTITSDNCLFYISKLKN